MKLHNRAAQTRTNTVRTSLPTSLCQHLFTNISIPTTSVPQHLYHSGTALHEIECTGVIVATVAGTAVAINKLLATGCCGAIQDHVEDTAAIEAMLHADWLMRNTVVIEDDLSVRAYEVANGEPTGAAWDLFAYMDPMTGRIVYSNPTPVFPDGPKPVDPASSGQGGGGGDNPDAPPDDDPHPDEPDPDHPFEPFPEGRKLLL